MGVSVGQSALERMLSVTSLWVITAPGVEPRSARLHPVPVWAIRAVASILEPTSGGRREYAHHSVQGAHASASPASAALRTGAR